MRISILLPYTDAAKYYRIWGAEEKNIDFNSQKYEAERCTISYAANELCVYLERLGHSALVENPDADLTIKLISDGESGEEFDIYKNGQVLTLHGNSRSGVLYAVYELLEAQGIRWYTPYIEYVPKPGGEFVFPEFKHYKYDMKNGRGFHFEGLLKFSESLSIWMARNRLNLHGCYPQTKSLQQKLCMKFRCGGHIFEKMLDPHNIAEDGRYFIDAHKDWYGQRDEEITAANAIRNQFCMTNHEFLEYLSKDIIKRLKNEWQDNEVIEIGGFDTWGASCNCDACRSLGNGSDMTLYMLSYVRQKINDAVRCGELKNNIRLSFYGYEGTDTLEAPTKPVPQNLIDAGDYVVFCPILRCYQHYIYEDCDKNAVYKRTLEAWEKTGMSVAICEYYNVSRFEDLPLLFNDKLCADIRYYINRGVEEIMYMHTPVIEWGVRGLTQYLYANISRNRNCDEKALISKYFRDIFGEHSEKVKAVYESVEKATELCASWRAWFDKSILTHLNGWDGKVPVKEFFRDSHTGDEDVILGEKTAETLYNAADTLRKIRRKELDNIKGRDLGPIWLVVNPVQAAQRQPMFKTIDKLNEDIRGISYGADVYRLMALFVKYYKALYQNLPDAKDIFAEIEIMCEKMSEYTYSMWFSAYTPEYAVKDVLALSHLKELYYRCLSHNK